MINWISFNGQRKKKTKGSNLFLHLLIRKTESQTEPLPYFRFLIVSPIYQETKNMQYPKPSHKFVGIVTATIDLEEVLAAFLPVASPYAKKENVWIMNRDGTVLFQSEHPEMVLRNIQQRDETCMQCHISFNHIEEILSVKKGTIEYELIDKPKKIATFTSLDFKNISWTIVLNLPSEEVSGFIDEHLLTTLILIGLMTVTLIAGSFFITRSNQLKAKAEAEAGKLWQPACAKPLRQRQAGKAARPFKKILKKTTIKTILWSSKIKV